MVYFILFHNFKKSNSTSDIIFVIFEWLLDRLSNCFISCEMDDRINMILFENPIHKSFIRNGTLVKGNFSACDRLQSI